MRLTGQARAFSLLELLIIIGLIAMVTGLSIAAFGNIAAAVEQKPLEKQFWEAVEEARLQAAIDRRPVYLYFDRDQEAFGLVTGLPSGVVLPDQEQEANRRKVDKEVLFYPVAPNELGNSFANRNWTENPLPYLVFHPSGVSTPARVVIRTYEDTQSILLDPFSNGVRPESKTP